jgi:hypothetical protein
MVWIRIKRKTATRLHQRKKDFSRMACWSDDQLVEDLLQIADSEGL